jgi:hypothetical protein
MGTTTDAYEQDEYLDEMAQADDDEVLISAWEL